MTAGAARTAPRPSPWRELAVPALATLLMAGFLVGLGLWQLQRLAWKEALIREIGERTAAAAVSLPPRSAWASLKTDDYDYRRVLATGTFDHAGEVHVFRPLGDARGPYHGVGDLVLTPFRLASRGTVIVNRGFVPSDRVDPATRSSGQIGGEVTITGLMREPEGRNAFTPADDPAHGEWFTRDPDAIARVLRLTDAAPFTLDEDAAAVPGGLPQGGETILDIPNDHLSYALTWFGLAAGLVGVFAVYAWRRTRGA